DRPTLTGTEHPIIIWASPLVAAIQPSLITHFFLPPRIPATQALFRRERSIWQRLRRPQYQLPPLRQIPIQRIQGQHGTQQELNDYPVFTHGSNRAQARRERV